MAITNLWRATATDLQGTLALHVTAEDDDALTGIAVQMENGAMLGLQLGRADLQELRGVLTARLVDLAP